MKVKELIKELQKLSKEDKELDVLAGDYDDIFYDTFCVKKLKVHEGYENDEKGQYCIVIQSN